MNIRLPWGSVARCAMVAVWAGAILHAQSGLTIATTSFPAGGLGTAYSANITVSGGTPPYLWFVNGNLPPGLQISGTSNGGILSGTPSSTGTYNFTLGLTDSRGASTSRSFTMTIQLIFSIVTSSPLPSGSAGQSYNQTLAVLGGTAPYQWSAGTGLPPGLSLNPTSGAITGTPTTPGNYTFSVQVTDSNRQLAAKSFSLSVTSPPLQITTAAPLFNGQTGSAYSQLFQAVGGTAPYTWSIASGDAGGLTINPSTGVLSGTPQTAGVYTFVVKVTDSLGASAQNSYSVTVTPPSLIITTGAPLQGGTSGTPYDQKFSVVANGGAPPYTWSLASGSVPGLIFDPVAIELSGTPTSPGTFNLVLQVMDSLGATATRSFSVTIAPAGLGISTDRLLSSATLNVPFSQPMVASGGAPPYTWSANGLPAGLTINSSTGAISGTPTAAGTFTPVITVADSSLNSFRDNFTLSVKLPTPPPLTVSGLSASAGAAQQFSLQVSIGAAYVAAIKGQLILSFQPNSGPGDSSIQFSTGGRAVNFNIPLGSTTATFQDNNGLAIPQLQLQTGTAAGAIIVSVSNLSAAGVDITPTPAPSITTQIAAAAPVITNIQVVRNADSATGCKQGQICLQVTGYSTAREVTQAVFTFNAASGQTLQSSAGSITVDVGSMFSTWFNSSTLGSQFIFVQPFTVTGDPAAVLPVSVTLTNRTGSTTGNVSQ